MDNSKKKVIVYCRESRDDYGANYERIETQRDLCLKYCNDRGYKNIIDVILQDDVSGTDFTRYEELKQRIKNREFDILVMKDSSRFGRNQVESLIFLELIQENEIELEFATKKFDEDFFGLEAWFNERRAKDDSIKIKGNLRHKMSEGKLLIRPHFGYKKVEEILGTDDKGEKIVKKMFVVDEDAAKTVRKIFDLYLQGYGYRAIANQLNDSKIATPSQHRSLGKYPVAPVWKALHVQRILLNQTYVGDMVSGTTEKISFKSKKTRRLPKEQWIITPDAHEAIVDRKTFDDVQKLISSKSRYAPKSPHPSPFSGLMVCGKCKSTMYLVRKKGRPDAFLCGKYFNEGKYKGKPGVGCTGHRVREEHLRDIVGKHLRQLQNEEYKSELEKASSKYESSQEHIEKTINKITKEIQITQKQYKQVYDDKLNQLIPEFLFIDKTKELEKRISILEQNLKDSQIEKEKIDQGVEEGNKFDVIMEQLKEEGLSKETVHRLIKSIIIYDEHEITEEDRIAFNISKERFDEVRESGGVIVVYNGMYQHVLTTRRIRKHIGTWMDRRYRL